MHIVLEGPDNAGKTTLARFLVQESGAVYFHAGGPPKTFDDEIRCMEEQLGILRSDVPTILDRVSPISQQVYNPTPEMVGFRNGVLEKMQLCNPMFVYCRPSTDRLLRHHDFTWREGETEELKQKIIENQHTFVDRYDTIMRKIPNICYDFESPGESVTKVMLARGLKGDEVAHGWLKNLLNYRR